MWKIGEIVHQTGHISAPDRARTFNESSLKSSDSALSRGFIGFAILLENTKDIKNFQKE